MVMKHLFGTGWPRRAYAGPTSSRWAAPTQRLQITGTKIEADGAARRQALALQIGVGRAGRGRPAMH
jgi:hypothetical protein